MKLALIIPGFQADERDWCIPAFSNLTRVLANSVELHVFTMRYPANRRLYSIGRVHVHAIGGGALRALSGRRVPAVSLAWLWLQTLSDVATEHSRSPFSVVVGIWATESGWLATQAARRLGLPSLVHLAGGELTWLSDIRYGNQGSGVSQRLVRACVRRAGMITAPSTPMKDALEETFPAARGKARKWALGVDTELFSPVHDAGGKYSSPARPFTFITVGSLIPVKNHISLLDALKGLRDSRPDLDFRWLVVGGGPLLSTLQQRVLDMDLTVYVDFLGEVRHDELPNLYREASCFLLGSRHEAQCMAALEAMSCGLPWVAPLVGALADCGSHALESGISVQGDSVTSFTEALVAMGTASDETRRRWGENARTIVSDDYELDKQCERLVGMIIELTITAQHGKNSLKAV